MRDASVGSRESNPDGWDLRAFCQHSFFMSSAYRIFPEGTYEVGLSVLPRQKSFTTRSGARTISTIK